MQMKLKISTSVAAGLSPPDCVSDPEEKELSDEDDDDRNHKHRRRETRSQSLESEALDQLYTRPYRKRNKPFENGHTFRDNDSQASETWKNHNVSALDRDFTGKFDRRRPGSASLPRPGLDLNQRFRANHTFYGDLAAGRGRGRDSGTWNQRDSRFSSVDIASQMVQPGSIAPSLFAGRGLPNIPNSQSASWSTFGLIPGVPNGGLDTLHPMGLQGTLRPPLNSLNMGITRQRCRDFEERGFCLRGDMCPMEHGVNRIVVEDVQSLSQFNLSVPLPNAPLLGTPAGPGSLASVAAPSTTLINSKGIHIKSSKSGMNDDGMGISGAYSDPDSAGAADLYDPDQPLWNNNDPETALASLHSPDNETETGLNDDSSDRQHGRLGDNADNECAIGRTGPAVASASTSVSVWGRIGGSKNKSNVRENASLGSSDYLASEAKDDMEAEAGLQSISRRGKRFGEHVGVKAIGGDSRGLTGNMRHIRKPSQKALRTLFVNGIPLKNNKREVLHSHFRKFGEVIDIYIPSNSERAFVQFSKREEAEAALKAPDAVLGNRFIKLWWANRDNIPDDGMSSGNGVSATATASFPAQSAVANKVKDNSLHSTTQKGNIVPSADVSVPPSDHPMPNSTNNPKVSPPVPKKQEALMEYKELLKKQELLTQKRINFLREIEKYQKQSSGAKGEMATEQAAKRLKVGVAADPAKGAAKSSDSGGSVASPRVEKTGEKKQVVQNAGSPKPKSNAAMVLQESSSFKQQIRPVASAGPPFSMNRYKLDNRPTTFRVIPPLPEGFADVAVLKEHFSSFGDISAVEVEASEVADNSSNESDKSRNCSARVTFTTRRSAEKAFHNGKSWQGHDLQFKWVAPANSSTDQRNKENPSSALKGLSDADIQKEEKPECIASQEATASGKGESENSERKSSVEHAELQEVSKPSTTADSGEEDPSTEENVC